jgi:hypothetical protein
MWDVLRERIRSILFGRIKLPGWAAILFAAITGIPDWKSRLDFWLGAVVVAGGHLGMIAAAIASPYFSPALANCRSRVSFIGWRTKKRCPASPVVAICWMEHSLDLFCCDCDHCNYWWRSDYH